MTTGASWNERGLSPELYQAAREAARRAGMSVDAWLDSTFGSAAGATKPRDSAPQDSATQDGAPSDPAGMSLRGARLSDTVAKLNARLEQLTTGRAPADSLARTPEPVTRDRSPPLAPEPAEPGIDQVIAEIAARQRALDEASIVPAAPAAAWQPPQQSSSTDFSSLERQLAHITEQIETLRRPCGVEDAVAALRADLAEIARAVNEALPRRALEALQNDVHGLAERIERGHGGGTDPSALQGIERRLAQVHDAINQMTPAEGLAGFEARVAELAYKMDSFSGGSSPDPETLRYLEAAINELRELSAGVASAEGVASIAGDVQALGARIDHLASLTGASGIDSLAQRVSALTEALDTRVEQMGPLPANIESLVKALTDKLNGAESFTRDQAAFEQLEARISGLADRIETSGGRSADLGGIERGIQQLTLQVREAREDAIATAERVARAVMADMPNSEAGLAAFRQDLETLHAHQAESDQRTQDTLEALHETLERLVDRLASVETGLHAPPRGAAAPMPAPHELREQQRRDQQLRDEPLHVEPPTPELRAPDLRMTEAPVDFMAPPPVMAAPSVPAAAPRPATPFLPVQRAERPPIDPDLPADTPLEPGTAAARGRTPAERIAASEAALGPALGTLKREAGPEVAGKANFIAAARRAAQAAANEGAAVEAPRAEEPKGEASPTSLIGRFLANRRRALMLGVSALLVLYGTLQVVSMFGGSDGAPERQRVVPGQTQAVEPRKMAAPTPVAPPLPAPATSEPASPTPEAASTRQSSAEQLIAPTPTASLISPAPTSTAPAAPANEVTGSVRPPMNIAAVQAPDAAAAQASTVSADKLPAAIGGPALRAAVAASNPAAEYEIGVRYSEGRGVPANMELAAAWFDRAASQGLAPALYRLGSLYEKGQGVKKDLNKARQLYLQAADKGNAKAIHNLAVLYAEGIDGKPDYNNAGQWFRKAALRGVADSQYNLGILYARGIGVDQNLAESYKWFALAAAQGDQDAAKKRDDVAARLDQQSLVAAKLAVQTFAAEPPADEAMNVKAPPGGWDRAVTTAPGKPATSAKRKPQST
jgi:localization factor PodJL